MQQIRTWIFSEFDQVVDYSMSSLYFSFSLNRRIRRFSYGYGLSLGSNTYSHNVRVFFPGSTFTFESSTLQKNRVLGLIFSGYIQLRPNFHLGLIYRPTLFRFDEHPAYKYEHLFSVDLAWKFRRNYRLRSFVQNNLAPAD